MAVLRTSYVPSVHGFRFGNDFRNQIVGPLATWGRCHGMCQVSLDYFYAGRPAPAIDVVDYGVRPTSGLGVASWSAVHADLFVRRDGDHVATKRLDGSIYSDWRTLGNFGGSLSPDAATWSTDRIVVVVRGPDRQLLHRCYGDIADVGDTCQPLPDPPEGLGGSLESSPAICAPLPNRVETYIRGADGNLWFKYYDGSWHDWAPLGRPRTVSLTSDPAAAGQRGWTTVLVRGSDNAIWQKEWTGNRWLPWRCLGGIATSAPAIATPFAGRAEAYMRGTDGNMYLNVYDGVLWDGWTSLGAPPPGLTTERPAAVSHAGLMDVYALANDQTVWHKRWSNGWQPWQSTEVSVSTTSRRLTDGLYHRLMANTIGPLLGALPFGPRVLPFIGTAGRFAQFLVCTNDELFGRAANDEMAHLTTFLRAGNPVSVGLINSGAVGHEMVVFGGDINLGGRSTLRVYDPNHPGCDQATVVVDPVSRTITSTNGQTWRALWVRGDITAQTPQV